MEIIVLFVLFILLIHKHWKDFLISKDNNNQKKDLKESVEPFKCDLENITPILIETIMTSNIYLKQKLISAIKNMDQSTIYDLQKQIQINDDFVIHLIKNDNELKKYVNSPKEKNININDNEIGNFITKQRRVNK